MTDVKKNEAGKWHRARGWVVILDGVVRLKPHWEDGVWVKTWRRWGSKPVALWKGVSWWRNNFAYYWGRSMPGAPEKARRPVWLERNEMRVRSDVREGKREGVPCRTLEVITGALQDSCIQLCNVQSTQASRWIKAEIQPVLCSPIHAPWFESASTLSKGCLSLIHIKVLWGPVWAPGECMT